MTRDAWERLHATSARPWRGPVHARDLLATLEGRVVELGAAGGKVREALPPGTLGLDWSRTGLAPPAVVGDVRALPLRDGSVDALVAVHVLGHLLAADRARAVAEWRRVLRPGGALVVEVFAAGDARDGAGREVEPGTFERGGVATHHFGPEEAAALFAGWDGHLRPEERRLRWGVRRVLRGRLEKPAT